MKEEQPIKINKCKPSNDGNVGNAILCLSRRVSNLAKELSEIERNLEQLIQSEIAQCNEKIEQEKNRALEQETSLKEENNQINENVQQESQNTNDAITQERNRYEEALSQERNRCEEALLQEKNRAEQAELQEKNRAQEAENNLNDLINQETSRAKGTESELQRLIESEKERAQITERDLLNFINNSSSQLDDYIADYIHLSNNEEYRAKAAENVLTRNLNSEIESRKNADNTLQQNINTEKQNRINSDNTLQENINTEELNRRNADNILQGLINLINSKIPEQASPENQLADKQYVNSSISTNSATYHDSHNLVSDLSLTLNATQQQIAEALSNVISFADNNDYAYVQIPTSVENPTEIAKVDKYKFNGSHWSYEYTLNNSGYTNIQWKAINSAITNELVVKLSNLPTYLELLDLLATKVDKTTTVNNHALSGNIEVTQEDVGLGKVGNFKAVSTEANQGLNSTEKSNARANIGAGTSSLTLGTTAGTAYEGSAGQSLDGRITALETALGGMKLQKITSQAYTALQTKDANTLYIIND